MGPSWLCTEVEAQLQPTSELVALGHVKFQLGVKILIAADRMQAAFCQRAYVQHILKTFYMETCNGSRTPEATSESTAAVPAVAPGECLAFHEMLGEHLADFDHTHMHMTKRVLRYLQMTKNHALVFEVTEGTDVNTINAQNMTEAEHIAMYEGTKDLLWMVGLPEDFQALKHSTPELVGDNMDSLYVAAKTDKHRNNKHIENNRSVASASPLADRKLVNVRDTRLAYADIIGEESLSGKLISAGPILERIDIFGAAVAENVACKGIATISVDRVDIVSQVAHGDLVRLEGETIHTGNSSLSTLITGYRHDLESGQFVHTLSAIMSCVALDENMRPSPGLPRLVDAADNVGYVAKLEALAAQRKDLSARWQNVQDMVDQLPRITRDMIHDFDHGHGSQAVHTVAVPDTLIEVQNSFLPKHLNRNNTIFGGEVLTWMDKVALYCARNFTKNAHMVTVAMNRIFFKLPITMDDIVTMHARVSSVRRHHVEVEVEVFVERIGSKLRRKSHTGYFTVVNLDRSYRKKAIAKRLAVDESDQESMRTLLKAQHRWLFDGEEKKVLTLDPLEISTLAPRALRMPPAASKLL
ncbi:hypothetical protein PybrP1_010774 [[Pythium] brassicae (nom. inval.)]|nr:hypothetical protein PybrP1_010774 [[Pythium] brassicae (nom. inval.)]